ncbi:hypothetical protein [Legionella oakridgensis]|uniref:Tyrosine specific protein phosphatases domain-containing protein n=2 Tax=Legionella oakridgensis TaxID=29423 RepID=W0B821_9GAMM|nr:hypothetical protein [Legionella oakridgensis]AHE66698.1 hypothetical protein Loa_01142 [Legionella oakridgensis ATCC 33761 = DSM 21215]ETO93569.1 hypothetical protein LOR_57c12960 [Legionella oakridgensis RV-2-2007]KTD38075.1 tyrosine phosphatase II superfamily protein [Legionella oakridgensis]STY19834.1 tyrosine phosphatase II superfamily protein [Legionella longbeachae]
METYLSTLAALLFLSTIGFAADDPYPYLVMDGNPSASLPKRFRMIKDMHVIGSGQFSRSQLMNIKKLINAPIIIVDLRQESHGFMDDIPISWYGIKNWENKDKSAFMIQAQQSRLLANLTQYSNITLYKILSKDSAGFIEKAQPISYKPETIYDEQQLAKELGLGYKRFYISDHSSPSATQIKAFKQFIKTVPANTWIYFHCRGGSGRTSTFMVLYDIFKHGKNSPLADILHKHTQLGGKDLAKLPEKNNYKYFLALQRLNLLKKQYQLVQTAN